MAPKHFLNNVTIPSPCTADWNSMIGNDQVRFCGHCNLDVHNLSQMTRSQAERLVSRANGRLCVRYHQDSSGQPLTLPVPKKLHRIGRARIKARIKNRSRSFHRNFECHQRSRSGLTKFSVPPLRSSRRSQYGQSFFMDSSLAGTITDQNGAVITGATVAIWNEQSKARSVHQHRFQRTV